MKVYHLKVEGIFNLLLLNKIGLKLYIASPLQISVSDNTLINLKSRISNLLAQGNTRRCIDLIDTIGKVPRFTFDTYRTVKYTHFAKPFHFMFQELSYRYE